MPTGHTNLHNPSFKCPSQVILDCIWSIINMITASFLLNCSFLFPCIFFFFFSCLCSHVEHLNFFQTTVWNSFPGTFYIIDFLVVVVGQQLVIILQPWSYNISFSSSYVGVYTPEKVATSLNTSKLFQQGKPFTSLTRVCGCFI